MKIELDVHTGDETYLRHVKRKLPVALDDFKPDIVVYNAGIYMYVLLYLVITSLFILLLYLVIVSGGPQYKFIYVYMYI